MNSQFRYFGYFLSALVTTPLLLVLGSDPASAGRKSDWSVGKVNLKKIEWAENGQHTATLSILLRRGSRQTVKVWRIPGKVGRSHILRVPVPVPIDVSPEGFDVEGSPRNPEIGGKSPSRKPPGGTELRWTLQLPPRAREIYSRELYH